MAFAVWLKVALSDPLWVELPFDGRTPGPFRICLVPMVRGAYVQDHGMRQPFGCAPCGVFLFRHFEPQDIAQFSFAYFSKNRKMVPKMIVHCRHHCINFCSRFCPSGRAFVAKKDCKLFIAVSCGPTNHGQPGQLGQPGQPPQPGNPSSDSTGME